MYIQLQYRCQKNILSPQFTHRCSSLFYILKGVFVFDIVIFENAIWRFLSQYSSVRPKHQKNYLVPTVSSGHIDEGTHAGYSRQGGYFNVFNALSELDEQVCGVFYINPFSNGRVSVLLSVCFTSKESVIYKTKDKRI